jgi:hypothetical protein
MTRNFDIGLKFRHSFVFLERWFPPAMPVATDTKVTAVSLLRGRQDRLIRWRLSG